MLTFVRHAREGLAHLWATPALRVLSVSFFAVVAFNGVDDAALVFLAAGPLDAGEAGASLLYAGSAVGLLIGYAVVSRWGVRLAAPALLVGGYALNSLGNLATGLSWVLGAAVAAQAVRGLGLAAPDVAAVTLIQRSVPRRLQGRVFGNFFGAIGLAAGLSYVAGAVLIDRVGPRVTLVVAGAGGLAVAAMTATRGVRLREQGGHRSGTAG